jgi:predicted Fe-Mo cluster-binding NifX family protein
MRIAVATDDGELIATHAGRCRGVVVFEIDGNTARRIEERSNTFTAHARGECEGHHDAPGGGHHSHAGLIGAVADCQALITRGMGPRLAADLSAHGIDPFVSGVERVADAAGLFAQGRLPRLPGTGCGRHA